MKEFPFVEVTGDEYTMGFELGRAIPEMVRRSVRQVLGYELSDETDAAAVGTSSADRSSVDPPFPGRPLEALSERLAGYRRLAVDYCPGLLEEVRGIAEGAEITLDEALLLQVRSDVLPRNGCTSFAVPGAPGGNEESASGVLLGQNWDYPLDDDIVIVLRKNPKNGPRQLMMTFAGCCAYMGINSSGVGQFATALPWPAEFVTTESTGASSGDPKRESAGATYADPGAPASPRSHPPVPHYFFKWRVSRCESLDEVRCVAAATTTKLGGSYVLSDSSGETGCVELTPAGAEWLPATGSFFVHTNTHLSDKNASRLSMPVLLPDSEPRYRRMVKLLSDQFTVTGNLDLGAIKKALSDHNGYPVSICRHQAYPDYTTSASLIAEPGKGLLHVCSGNPCTGDYRTYAFA